MVSTCALSRKISGMDDQSNSPIQEHPTLEYVKRPRPNLAPWLQVAGLHYCGSAIFACGTIFGQVTLAGSDGEAVAFLPLIMGTYVVLLIVPGSLVCLALLTIGRMLRRHPQK